MSDKNHTEEKQKAIEARKEKIIFQVKELAATGITNMFASNLVQRLAFDRDMYELVDFIESHKKEYSHLILTGEFPEDFEP